MKTFRFLLAASAATVALSPILAPPAYAQETTSSIVGTVTAGGNPIAGATVTITHVPSGTTATTTTGPDGAFNVASLRVGGPFSVKVSADGFKDYEATEIYTIIGAPYTVPIALQDSGEVIVVTASRIRGAGVVSQGPSTVLTAEDIAKVATINRDIRDLERKDPFARLDDSPSGGRAVSFAGQNARFNRFTVDGVPITDNFGLNTDGLPSRRSPIPLDAIGQFQTKVAPYDVREGNFQGGAINIVLRSGTNEFQGTGFYALTGDDFVGTKTKPGPGIPTGQTTVPSFKTENFGAEISGPIIKDRLFFMVSGERLRGGRPIAEGPTDNNVGTAIPNLTQAMVDQVTAIAKNVYNYNTGGVLHDLGDKDDRLVARIDANISDTQRLALTYTYANDAINLLNNTFSSTTTGNPGLGLASNAYIQGNKLQTGVAQLNSEWSDSFSTEVRGFYKHYIRIQDPVMGRGFAQFRVCTDPVSTGTQTACGSGATTGVQPVVSLGPDNSRQTNQLYSDTWGGMIQARYSKGGHEVRGFFELQSAKVFNAFLQNSAGNYYFDSLQDFQNQLASSISYANAIPSLNPDDSAARFSYQTYTFGLMDNWRPLPNLTISYGVRWDLYGMSDRPAVSSVFTNRYANGAYVNGQLIQIGSNASALSGRDLFQPRFGFEWRPMSRLTVRGGGGVFGGGAPDVYISNSFSNTGVVTNSVSSNKTSAVGAPTTTCTTLPTASCGAALNGVTGTSVPAALGTYLATNVGGLSNAPVNALDPNFKVPSQWRATVSVDYRANLGLFGDGWRFGADLFYSKVRNQVAFIDIRSQPIPGSLTPDGRQRYQNIVDGPASTNTNTDILLTNTDKGRAWIGVLRWDKDWDFGLSASGSFTYQDVTDQAPATSSTAGSNYSNGAFVDPNFVAYGTSNDEVKYYFKYSLGYEHAFFGDYKTNIALFGETRIGHPFSYTFQDFGSNRSAVFGVTGRSTATSTAGNRYLIYVPTANDTKVSYSNAAFEQAFNDFVNRSGLAKYRGSIAPRNAFNSKWITRLDLHVSQEVPVGFRRSRLTFFGDIENFTNFINKDWGQVREYVFPYNAAIAQVQCLTTPLATGTTPTTAQVAQNAGQACTQYRYSPINNGSTFSDPTDQVYVNQSLYTIRIGVRLTF